MHSLTNYTEAIDFLMTRLPMYQRIGAMAYKNNLDNSLALDAHMGHPHRKFKIIHVAGTNGKGSVSHMLAAVLQKAGWRTGLYTSPHLRDFRERIRINGACIPEAEVLRFVVSNEELLSKLAPSFFEMTVAMAFDYFAREQVEVAVVETGLGGRLDSTNIVHPVLSVITNIGLDHTALLGDTLEQIALEKAGIIKSQVPVVLGRKQAATRGVFEQKALEQHAPLIWAEDEVLALSLEQHLRWQKVQVTCKSQAGEFTCRLPLPGDYQLENVQTVVAALDELQRLGFPLNEEVVREGLEGVLALTGLMGRWQVLSEKPLVICDTGHNEDGVKWVVRQLLKSSCEKLHMVWGMVGDKDLRGILQLLPTHAVYYFTQAALPRSLDAGKLQAQALLQGLQGQVYPSVAEAVAAAKKNAGDNDLIFIGGSTFVVAEVL